MGPGSRKLENYRMKKGARKGVTGREREFGCMLNAVSAEVPACHREKDGGSLSSGPAKPNHHYIYVWPLLFKGTAQRVFFIRESH